MAYWVNARFRDGSTSGPLGAIVTAPNPHYGDTIVVNRHGRAVPVRVVAVWTPSARTARTDALEGVATVEAREI